MSQVNGQITLVELFATRKLVVPAFQRAFAWEHENLRSYLEDLRQHPADNDRKYYLGTILLTESKEHNIPPLRGWAIVDGQQRLTTTCIFVSAAIERLRSDSACAEMVADYSDYFIQKSNGRRKFHTIVEDDAFFERFIVGKEIATANDCDTPSQHRLRLAKGYFRDMLEAMAISDIVQALTILHDSQVLIHSTNTDAEATQIFELQNDRGKRLTDLEALKSFLMHGLYLHSEGDKDADLRVVQNNFAALYRASEQIEGHHMAPKEDDLLRYHCIAFERNVWLDRDIQGWTRPKELIRRILSDATLRGQQSKTDWIKGFSHRLRDTFRSCRQILEARDHCAPLGDMAVLGRIAAFWPLLLKCWAFDPGGNDFTAAARAMERFAFRATIAGKRADTGLAELRDLAHGFAGAFGPLTRRLDDMCGRWEIPRLFAFNLSATNDFYNWGEVATYLLWRYENHLRTIRGQQYPRLPWRDVVSPANADVQYCKDHIEPKDPNNPTLSRLVTWNPDDDAEQPRPFGEVMLHRLGNLVLDTRSAGASRGSNTFSERIPHYRHSGLLSQGEIERFASQDDKGNPSWDENAIRRRHKALVDFATAHM